MKSAAKLFAIAAMFAGVSGIGGGAYFEPAQPTKGQKQLFNQPKKLSKKQKAKNKKK